MKALLFSILLVFSGYAFADCSETTSAEAVDQVFELTTDVPSHLKGATITVKLADGRESTVPAEQFKVVPRKQEFIITRTKQTTTKLCKDSQKNRVSLVAGKGPKGSLQTDRSGNKLTVEEQIGAVGGLQYQRKLNERISVGIQGQTNETGSLLLGLDF